MSTNRKLIFKVFLNKIIFILATNDMIIRKLSSGNNQDAFFKTFESDKKENYAKGSFYLQYINKKHKILIVHLN